MPTEPQETSTGWKKDRDPVIGAIYSAVSCLFVSSGGGVGHDHRDGYLPCCHFRPHRPSTAWPPRGITSVANIKDGLLNDEPDAWALHGMPRLLNGVGLFPKSSVCVDVTLPTAFVIVTGLSRLRGGDCHPEVEAELDALTANPTR